MSNKRHGELALKNAYCKSGDPRKLKLIEEAQDYEDKYFKDMTMQLKSIKNFYMCYTEKGNELIRSNCGDPPLILISDWLIDEKRLHNEGNCHVNKLEINIKKGLSHKDHKLALLHEMIHAYEAELRWKGESELILIMLYKKLAKRFGQKKIDYILRKISRSLFYVTGHSIIFTLKSIDLDKRLKLPLGSVFGYGKTDWF
jgi:hypothetical protein